MYSEAEMAAFAALLVRALANEQIDQDEVEGVLPADLFNRFLALSIKHENDLIDRYDEERWKNWQVEPETIRFYRNQLYLSKKAFRAAPLKLEKMMVKNYRQNLFDREVAILAHSKSIMWERYHDLSDTDKLWTKLNSNEGGWPPELVDDPPMKVVLSDEELPEAYALRRVLSDIVGDSR